VDKSSALTWEWRSSACSNYWNDIFIWAVVWSACFKWAVVWSGKPEGMILVDLAGGCFWPDACRDLLADKTDKLLMLEYLLRC
jgi:hypothetical protein